MNNQSRPIFMCTALHSSQSIILDIVRSLCQFDPPLIAMINPLTVTSSQDRAVGSDCLHHLGDAKIIHHSLLNLYYFIVILTRRLSSYSFIKNVKIPDDHLTQSAVLFPFFMIPSKPLKMGHLVWNIWCVAFSLCWAQSMSFVDCAIPL